METGSEVISVPCKGVQCRRITPNDLANYNNFVRDNATVIKDLGMLDNIHLVDLDNPQYAEVRQRVDNDPVLKAKYALGADPPQGEADTLYALRTTRFWEVTPTDLQNYSRMLT